MKNNKSTGKKYKTYIYIIIYAVFMSFFCVGSSPILDYMDPDSQNFWLIGRALAAGQTAYIDIFDHKGPYIFFIDELAALITPYKELGLFFLECIEYSIISIIAYKIATYYVKENKYGILSAMSFLGISFNFFTFVTGNLTDSYSVLFQIISAYLILSYAKSEKIDHPPIFMFIHGIVATIVLLMRPNNVGMWIPFGIILAYRLITNKKINNFLINLFFLLLGVLTGFIPYIFYGLKHDCFSEMWEGMIIYDLKYTSNNNGIDKIPWFLKTFILSPSFLIVLFGILSMIIVIKFEKNRYLKLSFVTMFVCSIFFMNISMRTDGQYNQLYMIFSIPLILAFFNKFGKYLKTKVWIILIVLMTLLANLQLIKQITKYGEFHYLYEAAQDMKPLMNSNVPNKVQVTGCNSVIYNETETLPHIKYFITYGYGLDYGHFPDATEMQRDSILSLENDYVIVCYNNEGGIYGYPEIDEEIINCVNDYYEAIYEKTDGKHIVLYKKF